MALLATFSAIAFVKRGTPRSPDVPEDGCVMTFAANLLTVVAVSAGLFFFLAGTVGLLRFPDTLTRLHAITKADTLGLGLVVLGLLPRAASPGVALKLVGVWLLTLLASGSVSQLIARAVRREGSSA